VPRKGQVRSGAAGLGMVWCASVGQGEQGFGVDRRGMETAIFNPDNLARLGEPSPGKPRHGAVERGMECHWQGVAVCGEHRQGAVRLGWVRRGKPGPGAVWHG